MNASSVAFHEVYTDNLVLAIVRSLDKDIGANTVNQTQGCGLVKENQVIDGLQSGQDKGSRFSRVERTAGPFEGTNAGIAVQADHKIVCLRPGFLQVLNVPSM